jgi:uncharacterized damage-inducible protein DinB
MDSVVITLNEFNRHYLHRLIDAISDKELDSTFGDEAHSGRWILAHLAIAVDYGFKQLDMPMQATVEWHKAYGPGSQGGSHPSLRPKKEELLKFIDEQYATLCQAALKADDTKLDTKHSVPLLADTPLKTKRDLLAHVLGSHFAAHVGQLSAWRRLLGLPPLF